MFAEGLPKVKSPPEAQGELWCQASELIRRSYACGYRLIWWPVLEDTFKETVEVSRSELLFGPGYGVDCPPMELSKRRCLARSGLHVHYWNKVVCSHQKIDFALPVVPSVPGEIVLSRPDGWSQAEVSRAGLFGDFASKSFFVRLTGFQTTSGRNPNLNSCDRLPDLHQQYPMIRRQNDRSYSLSPDHRSVDPDILFGFIFPFQLPAAGNQAVCNFSAAGSGLSASTKNYSFTIRSSLYFAPLRCTSSQMNTGNWGSNGWLIFTSPLDTVKSLPSRMQRTSYHLPTSIGSLA